MTEGEGSNTDVLTFPAPSMPRLSMTEAQALSLIARHGADMMVKISPPEGEHGQSPAYLGGVEDGPPHRVDSTLWQLRISPGVTDALRDSCTLRRELEWAGARLRLHLSESTINAWLAANLPAPAFVSFTDPLLATAFDTLLAHACAALDASNVCGRPQVSGHFFQDNSLPHSWTLTVRHGRTGRIAFALLEADTLGLMLLANLIKRAQPVQNGLDHDALPVAVCAELGWTMLRASELSSLREQDTVFIDHYQVTPEGNLWLVAGGYGLRISPQSDSYRVIQGWTSLMSTVSEIPQNEFDEGEFFDAETVAPGDSIDRPSEPGFNVDTLPVRLTFSLGERQMTLGELRSMHPGEVFDLGRPLASGPVIVRANGRWFGTGDLVEIDGRVGVALRALGKSEV